MRLWIGLVVLAGIIGCGGTPAKPLPKTVSAGGKVTLDGQPLKGATVTFSPTGTTKGIECVGVTDDAGTYQLKQIRGEAGAPPGEYAVIISRFLKKDGSPIGPDEQPVNVGAVESLSPFYSDAGLTTLKASIPAAGGKFDFELKSK